MNVRICSGAVGLRVSAGLCPGRSRATTHRASRKFADANGKRSWPALMRSMRR